MEKAELNNFISYAVLPGVPIVIFLASIVLFFWNYRKPNKTALKWLSLILLLLSGIFTVWIIYQYLNPHMV